MIVNLSCSQANLILAILPQHRRHLEKRLKLSPLKKKEAQQLEHITKKLRQIEIALRVSSKPNNKSAC